MKNDRPDKCPYGNCTWNKEPGKSWCKRHPDGQPIPIPRSPSVKKESQVKKSPDEQSKEEPLESPPKTNGRPKHLVESATYLREAAARLKAEVKIIESAADALDKIYALGEK